MVLRYTEAPDAPRGITKVSSNIVRLPNTNELAEIIAQGDVFRFDETVEGPRVFAVPGVGSITNYGWMTGQYPAVDSKGENAGLMTYYWSPNRQYSFTSISNNLGQANGWVETLYRSRYKVAENLLRFCFPKYDSLQITASNMIARTPVGETVFTIKSSSELALELDFGADLSPNVHRIVRYAYKSPADPLPITVDSYLSIDKPQKLIYALNASILDIEFLHEPAVSLPPKVLKDIQAPGYRGIFEVTAIGQTQIIGTNRVPVSLSKPPHVIPFMGRGKIVAFFILLNILVCVAVYTLNQKTRKQTKPDTI